MSKGILKFYNTNEQSESKVIDSNSRMEKRLKELKSMPQKSAPVRYEVEQEMYDGDDTFSEGLDAEALDALTMDEEFEGSVIKANPEEEILAARAKADEIVATAEQLAIEYKENARREADIESARIKADAKQAGYQEGLVAAQAEYESKMRELEEQAQMLEYEYQNAFEQLEPEFVQTITDIYEHIFKVDFSEYKLFLSQLVTDAMRGSGGSNAFLVHFSSEDFPNITSEHREMLEAAAPGSKVEIVEDIALGRNQVLLETDNGVLDCGLDTQLNELKRKLMLLAYTPKTVNE